jgi:hypothetical protein
MEIRRLDSADLGRHAEHGAHAPLGCATRCGSRSLEDARGRSWGAARGSFGRLGRRRFLKLAAVLVDHALHGLLGIEHHGAAEFGGARPGQLEPALCARGCCLVVLGTAVRTKHERYLQGGS